MGCGEKYDAARVRRPLVPIATALAALILAACGSESVSVPETDATARQGAEIFATRCSGCHTIGAAGAQGSGNRAVRTQGPDFDQRVESYDEALFAIHNGGFSGAIMPQNIVVGDDAAKVAEFLAKYSGSDVNESARPTAATGEGPVKQQGGPSTGSDAVNSSPGATGAPGAQTDAGGGAGSGGGASEEGGSSGGGSGQSSGGN